MGAVGQMITSGTQLIGSVAQGISGGLGAVLGAVGSIVGGIINGFSAVVGQMAGIGSSIVSGIWSGISGASGWLMGQISGFVDDVISNIQGFFQINSPSKRVRDDVGVAIPEGLAAGVDKGEHFVTKAIQDMNLRVMDEAVNLNATMTQSVVPLTATRQQQGPINVEAALDPAMLAGAFNEALGGGTPVVSTIDRASIDTLASRIVDSIRIQSRQGVSVLG